MSVNHTRQLLIPVLVDAAGRSGTTALMQLLASSPAVVTEREHPYESRYLTYLYSWSRLLDGCPDAAAKWQRGKMLPGPANEIGGLPWRDLLPDPSGFASKCFLAAWQQFSEGAPGRGTHYIEKVPRWISEAVPALLPESKVIHLVRDPRDVWLSILDFNEQRGFAAFGRKEGQDEDSFFADFAAGQRARLEPLQSKEFGEKEYLLRYEELVGEPAATAGRVGSWLGLDLDPSALEIRVADHATGKRSAVHRWPNELSEPRKKQFDAAFGDLLDFFS